MPHTRFFLRCSKGHNSEPKKGGQSILCGTHCPDPNIDSIKYNEDIKWAYKNRTFAMVYHRLQSSIFVQIGENLHHSLVILSPLVTVTNFVYDKNELYEQRNEIRKTDIVIKRYFIQKY